MATYTATRAATAFPSYVGNGGGDLCVAWGTYDLTADPADGATVAMCKIPAHATVVGGYLSVAGLR